MQASRLYKAIAKNRTISALCVKRKDGIFTENEDSVHLLPRIHFLGFYSPAADSNNLPDTPTADTNEKGKLETNKRGMLES